MTPRPYTPRPYQGMATAHLVDVPRCALWAGMGLGKTSATLTALDVLYLAGENRPTLVVAPKRPARKVWASEAAKWNHLRHIEVTPILGDPGRRATAARDALSEFHKGNASVYTINYENLPWLISWLESVKQPWPFGTIVSDESTRLKGFRLRQGTQRSQALGRVAHKHCSRFIELSGTPSPNGLKDLWGQIWFLDAGARLGRTYDGFKQRWFRPSWDGYGIEPLPFAQEQIYDKLRDICLTIDAKDYFDLAEPISSPVFVDLPPKARARYDQMEKKMFAEIAGHPVEAFNAAAKTNKCLQLANGAAYLDEKAETWAEVHSAKLEALEEIVEEAAGMPVMVAYSFVSDRKRLLKAFPESVDLATDEGMTRFLAGKAPIGIAHPASMGHGVDGLQDVTNIIAHFGHGWDLELYDQINGRIGPVRQMQSGHDRPVFIYHIIARDTVDELVMARRESKRSVQDLLLEAMKRRGI